MLRVISSSPRNPKPVFDAVLESATRICGAKFGLLYRFDGKRVPFGGGSRYAAGICQMAKAERTI